MIKQFLFLSRNRWLYGVLSLIFSLSIILTNAQPTRAFSWIELLIRGAQIYQLSSISDSQEVQLGKEINQELVKSGKARVYLNREITSYVNEIGQRLARTSDRPTIPYTFQVVDDDSVNAFATMGGYVYINTGLMKRAENEAELASVIGHEIGHIVGRHAIKQMREKAISQGVLSAAGLDSSQAVQIGVELALSRPNSRGDELEADRFGLENIKKSGYAPSGMVSFMEKLLQRGSSSPTFLSTHPATSERIKLLQNNIDSRTANLGNGLDNRAYKSRIRSL
ncbi:MAG: M48 family metallopeptidase [Xenococcaceae cyanobacterium MO_167.B52]|nr:M48 family metallopeptidase [Xenococcaceae cyanobacterium MO_167.B52]